MNGPDPARHSILFAGELKAGVQRKDALKTLTELTNLDSDELLERLFSIKPVIINQVEDARLAQRFEQAFGDAGLTVWSEPTDDSHDDIFNAEISFGHYAPRERNETAPNFILEQSVSAPQQIDKAAPEPSGPGYILVFEGELAEGCHRDQVVANIAQLTKTDDQQVLEQLFSVVPVALLVTSNETLADEYYTAFTDAGLLLETEYSASGETDLPRCHLAIRNDAPPLREDKGIDPFVWWLLGLTAAALLVWVVIYTQVEGLLGTDTATTLAIELQPLPDKSSVEPAVVNPELPAEPVPQTIQTPAPLDPVKPEPATTRKKASIAKQQATDKVPVTKSSMTKKQLAGLKQSYFIRLLNHYAAVRRETHEQGNVTVAITLLRDGRIKQAEVVSSSSDSLTEIALERAYQASPYPPVPKEVKGELYRFELPLTYQQID